MTQCPQQLEGLERPNSFFREPVLSFTYEYMGLPLTQLYRYGASQGATELTKSAFLLHELAVLCRLIFS
jgi:hypothetical protein